LDRKRSILVADDDQSIRLMLRELFEGEGWDVFEAKTGSEVLRSVADEDHRPDLVVMDVRMPQPDGLEVLRRLSEQEDAPGVIVMTGYGSSQVAIEAMKRGAYDYLPKPFAIDEVLLTVQRYFEHSDLAAEVRSQRRQNKADPSERIVGRSPAMLQVFKTIGKVAENDWTVLVTGETGTGKELVAEVLHEYSARRRGPLVKVNCAALPETLLESELFGHEKGSFTSAVAQRTGRFELAHGGTIFLDEIGEITLGMQKKLLRVLQEKDFERVGGTETVKVNVRVIAATNKDLRDEVAAVRFREDLFYRLNVITVDMPPLRERGDDIVLLTEHFLDKHRFAPGAAPARISEEAMARLQAHEWPGNVRELEHSIQRAVVLGRGKVITPEHLALTRATEERRVVDLGDLLERGLAFEAALAELGRELAMEAVRRAGGDEEVAAVALGVDAAMLREKLGATPIAAPGR
jgi:two-component system response regulator AtoC